MFTQDGSGRTESCEIRDAMTLAGDDALSGRRLDRLAQIATSSLFLQAYVCPDLAEQDEWDLAEIGHPAFDLVPSWTSTQALAAEARKFLAIACTDGQVISVTRTAHGLIRNDAPLGPARGFPAVVGYLSAVIEDRLMRMHGFSEVARDLSINTLAKATSLFALELIKRGTHPATLARHLVALPLPVPALALRIALSGHPEVIQPIIREAQRKGRGSEQELHLLRTAHRLYRRDGWLCQIQLAGAFERAPARHRTEANLRLLCYLMSEYDPARPDVQEELARRNRRAHGMDPLTVSATA